MVELQIRISQGEKIKISQSDISFQGWAIEARINAEDPLSNFRPSTGTIRKFLPPGGQGIFVHTFLHDGQEIFPYFDPLLVKLIGFGKDRKEAISRLKRALEEIVIEGVKTNISFFKVLLEDKRFLEGDFWTDFIERSGILEKIKMLKLPKIKIPEKVEISEKEVAELVYQIYKFFQKETLQERKPSLWQFSERLKFFEE